MSTVAPFPRDWSFSVWDYHRMAEAGILQKDDRCELIEGKVIATGPIGRLHAACVDRLNVSLIEALERRAIVRVRGPLRLDDRSEPQPDFTLLHSRADFYVAKDAQPEDVHWLIEVMDSSAGYDRGTKLNLYARAGIVEVWLVDLNNDQVENYTDPSPNGYKALRIRTRGEQVSPGAFPDIVLAVDEILSQMA